MEDRTSVPVRLLETGPLEPEVPVGVPPPPGRVPVPIVFRVTYPSGGFWGWETGNGGSRHGIGEEREPKGKGLKKGSGEEGCTLVSTFDPLRPQRET